MNIIELMVIEKKNATQIRKHLKEKYNRYNFNMPIIYKIMLDMRNAFQNIYLYNIYNTENISFTNDYKVYAIDESLFTRYNTTTMGSWNCLYH